MSNEQKPSNLGDLKARLGKLKQGSPSLAHPAAQVASNSLDSTQQMSTSSASPLGNFNANQQGADPFAAAQLVGHAVPSQDATQQSKPFAGVPASNNPFAAAPAASANPFAAAPAASANPFAAAPAASANPFAAATAASANPFAAAPAASANPFAAAPAATPSASANPFAASNADPAASANPFAAANPASVDHTPSQFTDQADSGQTNQAEQNQSFQDLAPLRFGAQVEQESEFADVLNSGYNPNLIKKKLAITMTIAAGLIALLIGILMGGAVSQRRAHNFRVDAWQTINKNLQKPFKDYNTMDDLFKKMLAKKEIQWNLLEAIPQDLVPISATMLATTVPLEKSALASLSELIQELNHFFSQAKEHRNLSLGLRSELKAFQEGKGFEQYAQYVIYAEDFFKDCISRGRMSCKAPNPANPPRGRVVAIAGKLKSKGKNKVIDVVSRTKVKPKSVNASYLIQVPKRDVTGFGDNVIFAYTMRLSKIHKRLQNLRKIKASFDKTLAEKLKIETITTL